jgi:hypothetical protein
MKHLRRRRLTSVIAGLIVLLLGAGTGVGVHAGIDLTWRSGRLRYA